ncbi:beta-ketoacyl synthase [Streptomyces sp. NBC_00878]|uniref:beta-ketoacyl-[acyl-carrier-protein] synthase family protein n=1 Tax=Streptomyces sp. NBC_00878 TaxID=2975854 RepID=UPI00225601F3|nr:beta-ketoacyl-[acyl-carrier-protein] synthase family protein [Streptomyces sp. NBC_00878]MCX4904380.1 beta-ketoacyl-[acyl-carrier-protein] synthase family protein [Streptomyces sp. NBC_00878]
MNLTSSLRSVVVTGVGATTPLGGNAASTWEALLAGRSGATVLQQDWAAELAVRIAAPAAVDPSGVLPAHVARRLDRAAQFALIAAREAWADAGFTGKAGTSVEFDESNESDRSDGSDGSDGSGVPSGGTAPADPYRVGAVVGTGVGGVSTLLNQYDVLHERGARKVSPLTVPMLMPNSSAAHVGMEVDARAGVHTLVSACASGSEAIGYAIDMIRTGRADVVVAGGTEAVIVPLNLAAFGNMMAMSKRNDDPQGASRPYDKGRDGFVLGEGAGIVVLESAEHAARRGARVYCDAVGQGLSADSYHIAQPEPTGRGVAAALEQLLATTDIRPAEIAHLNAHATSTPQGDITELKALEKVLGDDIGHVAISATKSMTGHLLGGAGGIETVATVLALHHRTAPPTINVTDLDDEVDPSLISASPRPLPEGPVVALNNSFGFGGHNVVLGFRVND